MAQRDSRHAALFPSNYGALVALPDPRDDEEEEAAAVAAEVRQAVAELDAERRRPGGLIGQAADAGSGALREVRQARLGEEDDAASQEEDVDADEEASDEDDEDDDDDAEGSEEDDEDDGEDDDDEGEEDASRLDASGEDEDDDDLQCFVRKREDGRGRARTAPLQHLEHQLEQFKISANFTNLE